MLRRVHLAAALLATATIFAFWSATIMAEAFGTTAAVIAVKQSILWGMLVLVPAIATTGATGFWMGRKWRNPLVAAKRRRMPFIAANGVLVLVPSALFLADRADAGSLDAWFYLVQAIELAAGSVNLTLMGLNLRDGLRLRARPASGKQKPVIPAKAGIQ